MKTLQLLKRNFEKLRQQYENRRVSRLKDQQTLDKKASSNPLHETDWLSKLHKSKPIRKIHPPLMLGITVISLTSVIGYRFYNQPRLSVGTQSPIKVVAPKDGTFKDEKTTEEKRQEVRTGIIPVLKRDTQLTNSLQGELSETIYEIQQFRQKAGLFPFISVEFIPLSTQQYLRGVNEKEWQTIQSAIASGTTETPSDPQDPMKLAIDQLSDYGQKTSSTTLKGLLTTIQQSRQRYQAAKGEVATTKTSNVTPELLKTFLNLDDQSWQATQKNPNQDLKSHSPPRTPPRYAKLFTQ